MEYNLLAEVSEAKGRNRDSSIFFRKAYELEKEATGLMPEKEEDTLPRFIMLRSMAALAYKAGYFKEAEQLIVTTLAENPPAFIVQELREISGLIKKATPARRQNKPLHIEGMLTQADAAQSEITVVDADKSQSFSIVVPSDLLNKIVKSYWQAKVAVEATNTPNGAFILKNISQAA